MGMKKISEESKNDIVTVLRRWPKLDRLTWESLREAIAKAVGASIEEVWSRQSLSDNKDIYDAFLVSKRRLKEEPAAPAVMNEADAVQEISNLESKLGELQLKYDRLLLRHTQLVFNVSLLEGGSNLLDPLPDNTKSQQG
jgi:hypothetical protein